MANHWRFNGNSLEINWQLDGNSLVNQCGLPTSKLHWSIVGKPKPNEANDFHHWANEVLLSGYWGQDAPSGLLPREGGALPHNVLNYIDGHHSHNTYARSNVIVLLTHPPYRSLPFHSSPDRPIRHRTVPIVTRPPDSSPDRQLPSHASPDRPLPSHSSPDRPLPSRHRTVHCRPTRHRTVPLVTRPSFSVPLVTRRSTAVPFVTSPCTAVPLVTGPFTAIPLVTRPSSAVPLVARPSTAVSLVNRPSTVVPLVTRPSSVTPYSRG